jgi:hypothetical protein
LKEQQIQRYEATDYASAKLSRLRAVLHALGLGLRMESVVVAGQRLSWRRKPDASETRSGNRDESRPRLLLLFLTDLLAGRYNGSGIFARQLRSGGRMDLATMLTLMGIGGTFLGIIVTVVIYKLTARKPKIHAHAEGILCRCLTSPVFSQGWGIVSLTGKLRVSHRPVTVVDAQLSYKMDASHVRKNDKLLEESIPPLHVFVRVGNDENGSIPALSRRLFDPISLIPGHGEQPFKINFALGGNFAEEYSIDFFGGQLSSDGGMFIPMLVRFEYEDNGHFNWTNDFPVRVAPFSRQGWTPDGPRWIDDAGNLVEVRYGPVVHQA